jgi:hypothetical protein
VNIVVLQTALPTLRPAPGRVDKPNGRNDRREVWLRLLAHDARRRRRGVPRRQSSAGAKDIKAAIVKDRYAYHADLLNRQTSPAALHPNQPHQGTCDERQIRACHY